MEVVGEEISCSLTENEKTFIADQKSTGTSSVLGEGIFVFIPTASDFPQNHSVSRDLRLRSVVGQSTDVNNQTASNLY